MPITITYDTHIRTLNTNPTLKAWGAESRWRCLQGLMKKGESYPERVTRAVAVQAMMRRMHPQNVLRRGDLEGIKKGDLSPVSITVVKRQGKKKARLRPLCCHGQRQSVLSCSWRPLAAAAP